MKAHANSIDMNYEIAGTGDCLTLIHGAGDNLCMWYNQVSVFSQRFRVLTYDVRGFGATELPAGEPSIDVLAKDLYELLRALDIESSYVLGYSMGGRIGLELALRHPSVVKALVLASSAVGAVPPSPAAQERRRVLMDLLEAGQLEAVAEQMTVASFSPMLKERRHEVFQRYKEIKLSNHPQAFARVWRAVQAAPPPDLTRIACPVLIIAGAQDAFLSLEAARATHRAIAGSRLEILHTGHASAIEAPEAFNRIVLDFLERRSAIA